jgi:hypothetical protein
MKYIYCEDLTTSRIFEVSLHHSTSVELLEPTPGIPDSPYLDGLHAYARLGFQGASLQTNSWDIRRRITVSPGSNSRRAEAKPE